MDELGEMADNMLEKLRSLEGSEDVKAVIFLETPTHCMTALGGWDSDLEAVAAVLAHLRAVFEANGVQLKVIPIPRVGHDD